MNYDILVNKNNKLDEYYIPSDLVVAEKRYSKKKHLDQTLPTMLVKKVNNSFKRMKRDAKKLGFNIIVNSGYRSFSYQKQLLEYYINKDGDKAYTYCAIPGTSEHQTGLSLDIGVVNGEYDPNVDDTYKEIKWVQENCYKYGFILRYPRGKEHITKFIYEPWHFRYVGKKVANYIYHNNITLEEYSDLKDKQ